MIVNYDSWLHGQAIYNLYYYYMLKTEPYNIVCFYKSVAINMQNFKHFLEKVILLWVTTFFFNIICIVKYNKVSTKCSERFIAGFLYELWCPLS